MEWDTYHGNFHHDRYVNQLIVDNWRHLHTENLTFGELQELVVDNYELDEDIADSLCFRFAMHVGMQRRWTYIKMRFDEPIETTDKQRTNENGEVNNLTLNDLEIMCFNPQGTVVECDCSCDSNFMLQKISAREPEARSRNPQSRKCNSHHI